MSVQFAQASTQHMHRTTSVPQGSGATMCCWIKITAYGDWANPLSISADSGHFFGVEYNSGGDVYFHTANNTGYESTTWSTGSYAGWMFVAFVGSASGLQGYFHKAGGSWTAATNLSDRPPSDNPTMDGVGFAWEVAFSGQEAGTVRMRCMRVWNTTLTQTELQAERDSATPVKTSNLTFNNGGTTAATVGTDSTTTANMTVAGTPTDQSDEPPLAQSVAPGVLTLDLALQSPTVSVGGAGGITLQPGVLSLSLDQQAPTVVPGPISLLPGVLSLSLAPQDPVVSVGGITLQPGALALALDQQAPTLLWNQILEPSALALSMSQQSPTILPGGISVAPGLLSLALAQQAPVITLGGISISPGALALTLQQQAPTLSQGQSLAPSALALTLQQLAPLVYAASRLHWKPSESGRYFEDDYGSPVLVHADTGWCFVDQLTKTEAVQYATDMYSRHVNACVVAAPNHDFTDTPPQNQAGDLPWTGTAFQSSLNAAYWDHLLYCFQQLNARGIVPLFNPAYTGYPGTEQGWDTECEAASNAQMTQYGVDVSTYLQAVDVIWVTEGDQGPGATLRDRIDAMIDGLLSVGKPRQLSYHFGPESPSWDTSSSPDQSTWHLVYTYSDLGVAADGYTHVQVRQGYQQSSVKPVVMFESKYELGSGGPPSERIRRQAWGALAYGAAGHCYGHELLWPFDNSWADYLDDAVRVQMQHLHAFFNARRWWLLQPDFDAAKTFVTAGRGTEASPGFVSAAWATDDSWGLAYLPGGAGPITVDRTELSDTFTARWFNPRTGAYTAIGTSPNTGTEQFTAPDGNDWVLALEVDPAIELGMPSPIALTLAQQAPTLSQISGTTLQPGALSLSLQQQDPTLLPGGISVAPGVQSLSLAQQAPALAPGGISIAPGLLSLALDQQSPALALGGISVAPGVQALSLAQQSPAVVNAGVLAPSTLSLTLTQQAPTLLPGGIAVAPGELALSLGQFSPGLGIAGPNLALSALALNLVLLDPVLMTGGISAGLPVQSLALALQDPQVQLQLQSLGLPVALQLALALYAPVVDMIGLAAGVITVSGVSAPVDFVTVTDVELV